MRSQTLFGGIAAATHEKLFGPALILIRISLGIQMFILGRTAWKLSKTGIILPDDPFNQLLNVISEKGVLLEFLAVTFILIGLAFIFGLLVRPAALLLTLAVFFGDFFILPLELTIQLWPLQLSIISVAILALAGGLGHAFGLNGLILRNIRYPGSLSRLLFG